MLMWKARGVCAPGALLLVVALTGSACSEKAPEGQVIALVNGVEVTSLELENEIRAHGLAPGGAAEVRSAILEDIVDRELLAQEAQRRGLDRDPTFLSSQMRSRRSALARVLIETAQDSDQVPSGAELAQFVDDNPAWFEDRKILVVEQIAFDAAANPALIERLESAATLDEIESVLTKLDITGLRQLISWDTASLSRPLLLRLEQIPQGEVFILPQSRPAIAGRIVQSVPAAIAGDTATALALQKLQEKKSQATSEMMIAALRRQAEIDFQKGFEPSKN